MCNAMNHPPGCNCGWGGGWHGGGYGSSGGYSSFSSTTLNPSRDFHRRYSPSPASFIYKSIRNMHAKVLGGAWTEPNAICPECCQGVYFIKTENGGSIYFDELGPPWPKHVCTKNSEKIIPTSDRESRWDKQGWKPLLNFTTTITGFDSGEGFLMRVRGEDEDEKNRYFVCRIKEDVEFDIFRFITDGKVKILSILAHNKKGEFFIYEGSSSGGVIYHLEIKNPKKEFDTHSRINGDLIPDSPWIEISNANFESLGGSLYNIKGSSRVGDVVFQFLADEFFSIRQAKFRLLDERHVVVLITTEKSENPSDFYILEGVASVGKSSSPSGKLEIKEVISRTTGESTPIHRPPEEHRPNSQKNLLNTVRAIDAEIDELLKKIASLNQEKTKLIDISVGKGSIDN